MVPRHTTDCRDCGYSLWKLNDSLRQLPLSLLYLQRGNLWWLLDDGFVILVQSSLLRHFLFFYLSLMNYSWKIVFILCFCFELESHFLPVVSAQMWGRLFFVRALAASSFRQVDPIESTLSGLPHTVLLNACWHFCHVNWLMYDICLLVYLIIDQFASCIECNLGRVEVVVLYPYQIILLLWVIGRTWRILLQLVLEVGIRLPCPVVTSKFIDLLRNFCLWLLYRCPYLLVLRFLSALTHLDIWSTWYFLAAIASILGYLRVIFQELLWLFLRICNVNFFDLR